MKCRAISILIGLIGLMIGLTARTTLADNVEVVVKYGGRLVKASNGTGQHNVFQGLVMPNGPVLLMAVPNDDEGKSTYAPNKDIDAAMKGFQAGDLVDIVCAPSRVRSGAMLVQSARAYRAKAGENDPHGFIFQESFDHKIGDQTISEITLSKYLHKATYKIPTHRDDSGDLVSDDVILGIVSHLQAGDVVYAVTMGSGDDAIIKLLAPWSNHFSGKFVKLDASATVDSNGDIGPAVELTDPDGKAVTALIPGALQGKHWVPDPNILEAARGLKPDADVDFITADSGDKRIWLENIGKARPAEKTAGIGHKG
ncbi:MAG TPA: hypothetical protein VHY37_10755 [Tepidisphaeraceae bacterium]|jgi:hypothetical protein|nr:hypothetical protein [Tepidisphaeraceae bacterium]